MTYDFTRPVADLIEDAKARTDDPGPRRGIIPQQKGPGTLLYAIGIRHRHLVLLQDAAQEELKRRKQADAPTASFIDEVMDVIDAKVHEVIRTTVRNAGRYGRYEVLEGWHVYGYGTAGE